MTKLQQATVIRSTGSWYQIRDTSGTELAARIRGKFRLQGKVLTNPVAVGDRVHFVIEDDTEGTAIITEILPRDNYVVRQSPRKKHQLHLLASNVDLAVLVITIRQPKLKQGVIDRFLLMTEPHDIPASIVFNKRDLYKDRDVAVYRHLAEIYTSIGYTTHLISSTLAEDVAVIKTLVADKTTLICGQSGVGKSTLVNAMYPNLNLPTAEISEASGKGQHTTTFAQMYEVDDATRIIDTPGFKTLSFNNLEPQDVAHNFREFFQFSTSCKYNNCLHLNEPDCAVLAGLEEGKISELRYLNYAKILEEIEDQNYWERHGDL